MQLMNAYAFLLGGAERDGQFIADALTDSRGRCALVPAEGVLAEVKRLCKRPCFCALELAGDTITSCEVKDDFSSMAEKRRVFADAALSVCKRLPEGVPLPLLLKAFGAFAYGGADTALVLVRYLVSVLENIGLPVSFSKCGACGHAFGAYSSYYFDPVEARVLCARCAGADACALQPATLAAFRETLAADFDALERVNVPNETRGYLLYLMAEAFRELVGSVPELTRAQRIAKI